MGNVIRIEKSDPNTERHLTGPAKCLACGHEWTAVCPVGTINGLECSKCGLMRGALVYPADPEVGARIWSCGQCEGTLFYITPDGYVCAECAHFTTI